MPGYALYSARQLVSETRAAARSGACVRSVFNKPTKIATHEGHNPVSMRDAADDSVFDFDAVAGRTRTSAACERMAYVQRRHHDRLAAVVAPAVPAGRNAGVLCYDYTVPDRDVYARATTVAAEQACNVHAHNGVSQDGFYMMRIARDATLSIPKRSLQSVQVNGRAGHLPAAESNGTRYLKLPLNVL